MASQKKTSRDNTIQGFGVLTTQRVEIHPGLCKTWLEQTWYWVNTTKNKVYLCMEIYTIMHVTYLKEYAHMDTAECAHE